MIKKFVYISAVIALVGAIFGAGAFFGYSQRPEIDKAVSVFNKETLKPADVDFSPFWSAWNKINEKYVAKDQLDSQKMVWGAIQGMVVSLGDPYSSFFPPEESKTFEENISGDFEGVGMEIAVRKGILIVVAPIKGTPAYNAGIKAGDKIIKIGDKSTIDMTSDEAAKLIRGPRGTQVVLSILRGDAETSMEFTITREVIEIPAIETETKQGGIFVIKLFNFSANSSSAFRGALRDFIDSGNNKLILDLRNNPGGYLELAVDNASWFLPVGKVVVREKFSNGEEELHRSRGYDIFGNLPMIILVNEGSASASEIMAGALQEYGIAKLVGQKTFGKGSVQELIPVTPETSLKLTIAKWLTPNGRSISDEGLEPDYKVELTDEDFEKGLDPQMDKAVELLKDANMRM